MARNGSNAVACCHGCQVLLFRSVWAYQRSSQDGLQREQTKPDGDVAAAAARICPPAACYCQKHPHHVPLAVSALRGTPAVEHAAICHTWMPHVELSDYSILTSVLPQMLLVSLTAADTTPSLQICKVWSVVSPCARPGLARWKRLLVSVPATSAEYLLSCTNC